MSRITQSRKEVIRDLGDGLILRRAVPKDTDALAAFSAYVQPGPDGNGPDESVDVWTRELMSGRHPTVGPADITVVEDTRTGDLVSTIALMDQTWSYDGIEIPVGLPELVATHPDYRRRGLVRAQMETVHDWSVERGQFMQAILGIPWYYRQFGYEMALEAHGGRKGYAARILALKDGEMEPYRVRPAAEADLLFIAEVYGSGMRRYRMACVRSLEMWRHELLGRDEKHCDHRQLRIVETDKGKPVGFLAHPPVLWGDTLFATAYELKAGASWVGVTPSVLRYLQKTGVEYAEKREKTFQEFMLNLGSEHPVYHALTEHRLPEVHPPYSYYVRISDLPKFLWCIAPALEARLSESPLPGHTGEVKLNFYRDGLRLAFEDGKMTAVEPWQPRYCNDGDAAFPDLTFLQLLMGRRSLAELKYAFADAGPRGDDAEILLNALFPKQASSVWLFV